MGATISKIKFKKGVITVDYYVSGEDATIQAFDASDPTNIIYVDQEKADGTFSFGLPSDFTGEAVTVRVGGKYEQTAEATVSVTPTPAPTPDPESTEMGGIYSYVNKEDFTTTEINYDGKYMFTEADFKEEPNSAAYYKGDAGMVVYDEYAGAEGVFYMEGHALPGETLSIGFDPIKTGKAKISIKFMQTNFANAAGDGEVPFFSILDSSTGNYAVKNCWAKYTSDKVPLSGMYFYNGTTPLRYRNVTEDSSWHTLTYLIDMDTKTFDLEFDGSVVQSGNAFFSDVSELSKIYFGGSRAQWGSNYYIDEFVVKAENADEYNKHTVTFYNDDKTTVLGTKQIKDSRRLVPIDNPSRRGYTFINWYTADGELADFSSVTEDMSVYAKFLPKCTVEFYNEDKVTKLATITVDYAGSPKITPPTKEDYTFMGWVLDNGRVVDISSVTQDYTLYAWFEKQPIISYYDIDDSGNAVYYTTQQVDYATDVTPPAGPEKAGKSFIGWGMIDGTLADLSNLRGDRKLYAIYGDKKTDAVEDMETIAQRVNNQAGETVLGESSSKAGDYTGFQGSTGFKNERLYSTRNNYWITPKEGGNTYLTYNYTGSYNYDDARFYVDQSTSSNIVEMSYDFRITAYRNAQSVSANAGGFGSVFGFKEGATSSQEFLLGTASTKENRGVAIYDKANNKWISIIPYDAANPDYNWHNMKYIIDFDNQQILVMLDGQIKANVGFAVDDIKTVDYLRFCLLHGGHIGAQSTFRLDNIAAKTYVKDGTEIVEDTYTVEFYAEDGTTLLDSQSVKEGKTPEYKGVTPTKEPTKEVEYVFSGWTPDITSVVSNMKVTPVFKAVPRTYTVTFVIDGKETKVKAQYGTAAEAPSNPLKLADAQYTYTFKEWDKDFSFVEGDMTVEAVFEKTLRKYKVTFYAEDRTTILAEVMTDYGTAAAAPEAPEKEPVGTTTYTFAGWVTATGDAADLTNITKNVVVYAKYDEHHTMRTIEFIWGDVNNDGVVDVSDGVAILSALKAGQKVFGEFTIGEIFAVPYIWGDINNDGVVDISDSVVIRTALKAGNRKIGEFTIGEKVILEAPNE